MNVPVEARIRQMEVNSTAIVNRDDVDTTKPGYRIRQKPGPTNVRAGGGCCWAGEVGVTLPPGLGTV
jgi:hypothetical protein